MSKTKKRAMIESDSDDSGSSDVEQVRGGHERVCMYTPEMNSHFHNSKADFCVCGGGR